MDDLIDILAKIQEHLDPNASRFSGITGYSGLELCPRIELSDGTGLSVQACGGHYCSPRNDEGPWTAVEIGFLDREIPELLEFAEDPENPCETVYGYVPVETLARVILNAGGFAS